jgi:putative hydroxymethylpyrimidine transport system ATP-binding protein
MAGPEIRVEELSLRFGAGLLFDRFSMTLPAGQLTALLGASGVGKTSLLRVLAGLIPPQSGRILTSGATAPTHVGYMGQQDLLMPWLSALENVSLGATLRGSRRDLDRGRHLLDLVGLGASADALPATLSGGMRQRVALARTIYEDRPIVLMDEPFSALDALTRARVQDLAAKLLHGRTVLLITHDPLEACRLADQVVVMSGFPAQLSAPLRLHATPPRAVDDPAVLSAQGTLMRSLLAGVV